MKRIGKRFKVKDLRVIKMQPREIGHNTKLDMLDNETLICAYKAVNEFAEYFIVGVLKKE